MNNAQASKLFFVKTINNVNIKNIGFCDETLPKTMKNEELRHEKF